MTRLEDLSPESAARYRGLRYSTHVELTRDDTGLLVRPEVARKQIDQETAPRVPAGDESTTPPPSQPGESPLLITHPITPAQQPKPKRYHGTVTLDPARAGRDASRIADEVLTHLVGLVGVSVCVTLEIEAQVPGGTPDNVVRTVTENSRTLKFTNNSGFEPE